MKGTIRSDGYIKADNGQIYPPDMIHGNTILLVRSSWARFLIKDVKGKRVEFDLYRNNAYNFKLVRPLKK